MLSRNALKFDTLSVAKPPFYASTFLRRGVHYDGRNRLSNIWAPTQRLPADVGKPLDGHDLLLRAGFLRQAHLGIFHLLPLGLRVQDKIERLIDKHMLGLGASKVSLSSLSSEELWQRSGRLDKGRTSELLRLQDRKGGKYLLSPTHEEEITTIVANAVKSYKNLPLRLYQVSRKYRDEPRPRQGLLRGREFLMKDLYTFDATEKQARQTYKDVRNAYVAFLEDLKVPYLTARADSGNMGGDLSHEYHFTSAQGEDTIICCDSCDYSINEELYVGRFNEESSQTGQPSKEGKSQDPKLVPEVSVQRFISKDRKTRCSFYYSPGFGELNIHAVKALFPTVDPSVQAEQAMEHFDTGNPDNSHVIFSDPRLSTEALLESRRLELDAPRTHKISSIDKELILLTKAREGDPCPSCKDGTIQLHQAVEIGHTFHLGTRYSIPFDANVLDASNKQVVIQMGCHGIGVSRLIGAVASLLADSKGLNWPLAISPFEVLIVPTSGVSPSELDFVYDELTTSHKKQQGLDVAIDDRDRAVGWKLKDADLVGYPFIVVMGNAWRDRKAIELQCRRLGLNIEVSADALGGRIREYGRRL